MVVDRHRHDAFGRLLTNDVFVEERVDFTRFREFVEAEFCRFCEFFFDDLVTQVDALVADIDTRASDEFLDLFLRLTAERAFQQFPAVSEFRHRRYFSLIEVIESHTAPRLLRSGANSRRRAGRRQGVASEIRMCPVTSIDCFDCT